MRFPNEFTLERLRNKLIPIGWLVQVFDGKQWSEQFYHRPEKPVIYIPDSMSWQIEYIPLYDLRGNK